MWNQARWSKVDQQSCSIRASAPFVSYIKRSAMARPRDENLFFTRKRVTRNYEARKELINSRRYCFVCIGSDRSTGDLRTISRTRLKELALRMYGTLKYPIHALNIKERQELKRSIQIDLLLLSTQALVHQKLFGIRVKTGP